MAAKWKFCEDARWIWHPAGGGINQYVDFVREFSLPRRPNAALLRIAVDSDYRLWINGTTIQGRQFPCYPQDRFYNAHDIQPWLRKGRNRIAILAYFRGSDASEYRLGTAGLLVQLDAGAVQVVSDNNWRCRIDPVFRSGVLPQTTPQMGYTVECDARQDDGWHAGSRTIKQAHTWDRASEISPALGDFWKTLKPRPLPLSVDVPFVAAHLIVRGELLSAKRGDTLAQQQSSRFVLETSGSVEKVSPAQQMMQDFRRCGRVAQPGNPPWRFECPRERNRGAFALFDLGNICIGELRLIVDAPAGARIDVAHGEHLDDLGVRSYVGTRHFADRFICKQGRNQLTIPFRRLGARYLQLHMTYPGKSRDAIVIHQAGVWSHEYSAEVIGQFESPDRLMSAVRDAAVRTLRLSMADHFSDCPWREQSLYAYDARSSAIFNYYTFGDYALPAQSLRLLGQGLRDDGLLELCAPAKVPVNIPVFSLAWICAVRDHYLFSGSSDLFEEHAETIGRITKAFLSRLDAATGLYRLFDSEGMWTFYEWAPGLDFKNEKTFGDDGKFRLDAPHNLHLIEAMDAVADMLEYSHRPDDAVVWRKKAQALKRAVARFYWDDQRKLFASFGDRKRRWHFSATVQALAVVTGTANAKQRALLQPRLFELPSGDSPKSRKDPLIPMTLSTMLYGLRALQGAGRKIQRSSYDAITRIHGGMVLKGARTLWETERGADEFDLAGSLCHAWSASPLWYTQAYLLGVEPLTPGFGRFRVRPHTAALPNASGFVPTPHGPISVAWHHDGEAVRLSVKSPQGLIQS